MGVTVKTFQLCYMCENFHNKMLGEESFGQIQNADNLKNVSCKRKKKIPLLSERKVLDIYSDQ